MPPKVSIGKMAAEPKEPTACILRYGKANNIVEWKLQMQTKVTGLYGLMGTFFSENVRYVIPAPTEAEYAPPFPAPAEGEAVLAYTAAQLNKLREGALEGRRKETRKQKLDEHTVWPMMWELMSPASQSRVKEKEGYEEAYRTLDCVALWLLIRHTHLTHIYGNVQT